MVERTVMYLTVSSLPSLSVAVERVSCPLFLFYYKEDKNNESICSNQ